jgi:hypothetical protein
MFTAYIVPLLCALGAHITGLSAYEFDELLALSAKLTDEQKAQMRAMAALARNADTPCLLVYPAEVVTHITADALRALNLIAEGSYRKDDPRGSRRRVWALDPRGFISVRIE